MTEDLLRAHVERGADHKAWPGERRMSEVPLVVRWLLMHIGQCEVKNLRVPTRSDHGVVEHEVAVNDAVLVRFGHRIGSLQNEVEHASEIHRSFANHRG